MRYYDDDDGSWGYLIFIGIAVYILQWVLFIIRCILLIISPFLLYGAFQAFYRCGKVAVEGLKMDITRSEWKSRVLKIDLEEKERKNLVAMFLGVLVAFGFTAGQLITYLVFKPVVFFKLKKAAANS